mgnify:CR=1 FL=1
MIPPFSYNFYLTVTLQVVLFEPLRIVIVAVPFFRPLITPPDVTVTIFLLDDVYVTFSWLVTGVTLTEDASLR